MPKVREQLLGSVAYRCDTRPPSEIFENGFWNKKSNLELVWPDLAAKMDFDPMGVEEPAYQFVGVADPDAENPSDYELLTASKLTDAVIRFTLQHKVTSTKRIIVTLPLSGGELRANLYQAYAENQPVYRTDSADINPETAVCFALLPAVTPYFPLKTTPVGGERVWLYAVFLNTAVHTYKMAAKAGSALAFAREVATEHVPPQLVICATQCWRKGRQYPGKMLFNLDPQTQWNQRCYGDVRSTYRGTIDAALTPYQGYITLCPTPTQAAVRQSRKPYFALDSTYWSNVAYP